jgi:hypothetical protein
MSPALRRFAFVWVGGAVLLAIGSEVGGDVSIIAGLAWLVWTAPIGFIWQFWLYDLVLKVVPANVANYSGLVIVFLAAYAFWFYAVPRLVRLGKPRIVKNL